MLYKGGRSLCAMFVPSFTTRGCGLSRAFLRCLVHMNGNPPHLFSFLRLWRPSRPGNRLCTCGSLVAKWKREVGAHLGLSYALRCLCACSLCFWHAKECVFDVFRRFR